MYCLCVIVSLNGLHAASNGELMKHEMGVIGHSSEYVMTVQFRVNVDPKQKKKKKKKKEKWQKISLVKWYPLANDITSYIAFVNSLRLPGTTLWLVTKIDIYVHIKLT